MRTADARESEGAAVEVGRQLHVGLGGHRAQPDVPGAAAHVPQRIDPDLLARRSRARRRARRSSGTSPGARTATVSTPADCVATVGDHERDAARRAGAVRARRTRRCRRRSTRASSGSSHGGRAQEERVAVGIDPVAEHGRRDTAAAARRRRGSPAAASGGAFSSGSRTVTVTTGVRACRRGRRRRCSRTSSLRMPRRRA